MSGKQKNLMISMIHILGLSGISAWSMVQPHAMEKFAITSAAASVPFYVFSVFFTVGSLLSGRAQKKSSLRKILFTGALLCIGGLLLTAFIPVRLPFLLIFTYGVLLGSGTGYGYNAVISTMQEWYSDRLGFVSGILLCMVGVAGFSLTALTGVLLTRFSFSAGFVGLAVYYLLIYTPGILFLKKRKIENDLERERREKDAKLEREEGKSEENLVETTERNVSLSPSQVLRTPHYYLITLSFLLAVPSYTLIIPVIMVVGPSKGLTQSLCMASALMATVAQTLGRLVFPALSDKVRENKVLLTSFAVSAAASIIAYKAEGIVFFVCFLLIAMMYGSFMGLYPAISTKYFGIKYAGMNYALVMIGNSLAGIVCPILVYLVPIFESRLILTFLFEITGFVTIIVLNRREEVKIET